MATRRGFLGVMAASPVALPELGKSLANDTASFPVGYANKAASAGVDLLNAKMPPWKDSWVSKGIESLLRRGPVRETENRHPILDVDLHVNRSMSLAAKYNVQLDRNAQRSFDMQLANYYRDASNWVDAPDWVKVASKSAWEALGIFDHK